MVENAVRSGQYIISFVELLSIFFIAENCEFAE